MAFGKRRSSTNTKKSKTRPKRNTELLSSVINESVVGSAINTMRDNPEFEINDHEWLILLLPTQNIGGLSAKQKNNEDKGSLIELIQADEITVLATADMLEQDVFGIIPTEHTLERMDDFTMLVTAEYYWGIVTVDESGTELSVRPYQYDGKPATYDEAVLISKGKLSLSDIGIDQNGDDDTDDDDNYSDEYIDDDYSDDDDDYSDDDDDIQSIKRRSSQDFMDSDDDDDDDSDEPVYEDSPFSDDVVDDESDGDDEVIYEETPFGDDDDEVEDLSDDIIDDDEVEDLSDDIIDDDDVTDNTGEDDDTEISRDEVLESLNRRYFADDLNLNVSLVDFNTYFQPQETPLSFENYETEGDDWLGDQLSYLTHRANDELANLRKIHIDEARKLYLDLMSKNVENIVSELSTSDPSSYYGELLSAATSDYKKNQERAEEIKHERVKELRDAFEANIKAKREEAAAQAEVRYREKHGAVFENDLKNIDADIEAVNVEQLRQSKSLILNMRQADAATRMDIGINEALSAVQTRWASMFEDESKVLAEWQSYMKEYLDEHRKEDVARIETLQKELANNDMVERMRRDFQAQSELIQSRADAAIAQSREELVKYKETMTRQMEQREAEWELREKENAYEQERSKNLSKKLMKELRKTEKLEHKRYKNKLSEMSLANERLLQENTKELENQVRYTKLIVFIMLIFAVATLAVGVLIGFVWSGSLVQPNVTSSGTVLSDYQDYLRSIV